MKVFDSLKTRGMVWVWKHTPNCAEMSRLASRALEQPLCLKLRLKLRLYFLICAWCKRYFKHLEFLHQAGLSFDKHVEALSDPSLSLEARQRMVQRLKIAASNIL